MRKVGVILMALAIGFALAGMAGALHQHIGGYLDGESYLRLSPDAQKAYVSGVSDALSLVAIKEKSPSCTRYSDCKKAMTNSQIHAIVEKYLKDHPEVRKYVMADIVLTAVLENCPPKPG